jgi:HAD superfamily phosphatase (TIGR01681 family)
MFKAATGLPTDRAMIYLTQHEVNFDINKAVALFFDYPDIGGGAAAPVAPAPAPVAAPVRAAAGSPPIKVFFFDLDNTLTAKELEKRDNLIELAHPTEFSWTYTSQQVIDILKRIDADPNSMWYVISAGENENVLDMLEGQLGFKANGRVFNIGEDVPKSYPINQILTRLRDSGNNFKSIAFIDDTPDKITEVSSTIPGIIPIGVNSHFSEDPGAAMRQFWRNIILDNEKIQIDAILGKDFSKMSLEQLKRELEMYKSTRNTIRDMGGDIKSIQVDIDKIQKEMIKFASGAR